MIAWRTFGRIADGRTRLGSGKFVFASLILGAVALLAHFLMVGILVTLDLGLGIILLFSLVSSGVGFVLGSSALVRMKTRRLWALAGTSLCGLVVAVDALWIGSFLYPS